MGVWDGLDESEISRPEILFQSAPGFRCIIFSFATSRIHKKHVQLGHADGCRGNKHRKTATVRMSVLNAHLVAYVKSILGGHWLLGAQGSHLPLPNG